MIQNSITNAIYLDFSLHDCQNSSVLNLKLFKFFENIVLVIKTWTTFEGNSWKISSIRIIIYCLLNSDDFFKL
jgi:hypothetical protein